MSIAVDCPACVAGNHTLHDARHGVREGLIGGTYCGCTGDCAERRDAEAADLRALLAEHPAEAPAQDVADVLAVLADHRLGFRDRKPPFYCTGKGCTWHAVIVADGRDEHGVFKEDQHRAHVAAALAPLLAAERHAGRVEALRAQAERFRTDAAYAWGDDKRWVTTGTSCAELAASWCDESADRDAGDTDAD